MLLCFLLFFRQILLHQRIICYIGTRKTDGMFQVILQGKTRPYRGDQWRKGPYIQGEKLDRSSLGEGELETGELVQHFGPTSIHQELHLRRDFLHGMPGKREHGSCMDPRPQ